MSSSADELSEFDATLVAKRAEVATQLEAAIAELPPARKAVKVAKEAAFVAGRRFGTIQLRITRATRPVDETAPVILQLLEEARRVRNEADGRLTLAEGRLKNVKWVISCRRDDLDQLDRLIDPLPIDGRRLVFEEAVKRPPPPGPTAVDPIVFPAGQPAGEAA